MSETGGAAGPCVLASLTGRAGMSAAVARLQAGASALDAVEAGIRPVEADPSERSVGVGGHPNMLGQVELDASIMDGWTLKSGAVGGLQGFVHPISVARLVMERLPHAFLIGEGAARFARECGAEAGQPLTAESEADWRAWLEQNVSSEAWLLGLSGAPLAEWVWRTVRPKYAHGTVVFLARDVAGDFGGGVSTSGWSYKYPGRLGDSPVVGAGLYVDNRYGAAGCLGHGELAIRAATARSVVLYMKMGASVQQAVCEAADDLRYLERDFEGLMAVHALDRAGQPYVLVLGDSLDIGTYLYWAEAQEPVELEVVRAGW